MRWIVVGGVLAVLLAGEARAEDCRAGAEDDLFATCFDLGNRVVGHIGYGGVGFAAYLRGVSATDDPAVSWRNEHAFAEASWDGRSWRGTLYRGRYLRHSKDGHLLLPTSPPRKLYLPFDVGAEADALAYAWTPGGALELTPVRAAVLFDLARAPGFRRRLVLGLAGRWDVSVPRADEAYDLGEQRVAPLSLAYVNLHAESGSGLAVVDASFEGGPAWSSRDAWRWQGRASLSGERVLIALEDRPLSAVLHLGWEDPGRGVYLLAGLRVGAASTRRPR